MSKNLYQDYLILGGGIAGVTAAETIRSSDQYGSVGIIAGEKHVLYSRVLLPSFIRGKIKREQVFLRVSEDYAKKNIGFWFDEFVTAIFPEKREVHTNKGHIFNYRKLIITTGGNVRSWSLAGAESMLKFRLQTIEDADNLRDFLLGSEKAPVVVIGGGFIGLEFIESFLHYKFETTVLLQMPHYFGNMISPEGAEIIETNMVEKGVSAIHKNINSESLSASAHTLTLLQKDVATGGMNISASAIGIGIGIDRELSLFQNAGIETMRGIKVNECLETNVESIYAAGDIAEYHDVLFGKHLLLGNWNNAFAQGRIAGENATGKKTIFRNIPNYSIQHLGLYIVALGDVVKDERIHSERIFRIWPGGRSYVEFILREEVLIGAILINRAMDRVVLSKWILERKNMHAHRDALAHYSVELGTII